MDGEIGKRQIREGGCEETFLCLSLNCEACRFTVPSAVAPLNYLYKQWYTLADFLPNWNFPGVSSTNFAVYLYTFDQCVFNMHVCNTKNSLNIRREE